jgi:PAS domain S-box-containing protein
MTSAKPNDNVPRAPHKCFTLKSLSLLKKLEGDPNLECLVNNPTCLLNLILQFLPDTLVYLKNLDGVYLLTNNYLARHLELPSINSVLGKKDHDIMDIETATRFQEQDEAVMKSGEPAVNVQEWLKTANGNRRALLSTRTPVFDDDGKIVAILGVSQDITERNQLERQLRQAEKMEAIGQLAGGIAHDFNNHLAGIMGCADMLRYHLADNRQLYDYADMIVSASQQAAERTAQLLAFARRGKYQAVPVNIHNIINEVMAMARHSFDRRVKINADLKAPCPVALGDPHQLQNAFLNLAINAGDAMPNGGDLWFETEQVEISGPETKKLPSNLEPGKFLKITVTDSGIGMSESTMKRIFDPFFSTKKNANGTGMGLAAVYGTIMHHKGMIEVESVEGKGATFKVFLPLAQGPQAERAAREETMKGVKPAHVLLVDDEVIVCNMAAQMLRGLGYHVTACNDGADALETYRKGWEDIDVVVLDMVMPELSGSETFRAMKNINPDVKVVIASGFSIAGEAQELLDEGAFSFIQKPFLVSELSDHITKALEEEKEEG